MQLKYIDYTDFDHLVNTLKQDYKPLSNRIKKLEESVRRAYGTIRKRADSNHITWKSPVSGNVWSIYYIHNYHNDKVKIDFYPFTEFLSSRGEKEFLRIGKYDKRSITGSKLEALNKVSDSESQNTFRDFLVKNNLYLLIYRGHFMDRFRMRTEFKDYITFDIIYEFVVNPDLVLVDNYQQKHDWLMYLHPNGVAMIKQEDNYLVFDTFVAKDELKANQTTAIRIYLNRLDDIKYGVVIFLLLSSDVWLDFIDKERLLRILMGMASTNKDTAKSMIDLNLPMLTKLWGESFLKLFPFVKKPRA
jgi:hypothetical protein